jgi:hypothetical protein
VQALQLQMVMLATKPVKVFQGYDLVKEAWLRIISLQLSKSLQILGKVLMMVLCGKILAV